MVEKTLASKSTTKGLCQY